MFGKNKIQKPENHNGEILKVTQIFKTFQGEGPYSGWPAIFIRLSGCNLACNFCDTEFDDFEEISLEKIIERVSKFAKNKKGQFTHNLIVITGGEPMRQPIEKIVQKLIDLNFLVQIETNGTIFRNLPEKTKIICSPKIVNGKYHQIRPDLLKKIEAFKFIISANKKEYSAIAEIGQSYYNAPIYLQPMDEYDDEKNQNNIELTKEIAEEIGAKISLQTHKILKIE